MKLSEIEKQNFSDEEIQKIVYSDIEDTKKETEYVWQSLKNFTFIV